MTTQIILTIALGLLSINAINFLLAYFRLLKWGVEVDGTVQAYEMSKSIVTKNTTIPKIEFQASEKQSITGKPIHSWFIELNNYKVGKKYIVYYDNLAPTNFIIKSNIEAATNIILVICAFISIVWLIVALV